MLVDVNCFIFIHIHRFVSIHIHRFSSIHIHRCLFLHIHRYPIYIFIFIDFYWVLSYASIYVYLGSNLKHGKNIERRHDLFFDSYSQQASPCLSWNVRAAGSLTFS